METKFGNVLITGASSGIGEALCLYYAASGTKNIFICGRNKERLEAVKAEAEKFGTNIFASILDVTKKNDVKNWINECNEKAEINLVIANAGVASLEEVETNIYNTFDINVYGVLHTILPTIDIYRKRKKDNPKAIALLSSIAGYHGMPACPSYSASKACVKAYGEGLRPLLAKEGIQISTICPGFVKSGITDKNTCSMPFFMSAKKASHIIGVRLEKNVGLIAFPWPMRFAAWFAAILPNAVSDFLYARLPYKV